ncbi:MAG: type VI secretion system membrane subunit TssM [Rhodocyclaceae bacterium]
MDLLKRLGALVFSRYMLLALGIVLLAGLVWFIGPLLSFDGLRPLESVVTRILVILLLLALLVCLVMSATVLPVAIAAACLLVWQGGPLFAIGAMRPLAPPWVRLLLIGGVLLATAAYGIWRLWRYARQNPALVEKWLRRTEEPGQGESDQTGIRAIEEGLRRTLRRLKDARRHVGWKRLFEGKRYIYQTPWYLVLGAPGSGKTSALLNVGLRLPLPEQAYSAAVHLQGNGETPKGHPGGATKYIDWWQTDEFLLIDSSGRYVKHDDSSADAEWNTLTRLLRKARPGNPINGAVITLSIEDLLEPSYEMRMIHASSIRMRLINLRQTLRIQFPIYVLVTKSDLLRGFVEYFQYLSSDGRHQVLGFTLPLSTRRGTSQSGNTAEHCRDEMKLLVERLEAGIQLRLHEEHDQERCDALYDLPRELDSMGKTLVEMLEQIFFVSPYDDTTRTHMLRGVYFTSAAQGGATHAAEYTALWETLRKRGATLPVDATTASAQSAPSAQSARAPSPCPPSNLVPHGNRSYFLHDVFRRILLAEAQLVRPNLRWVMRHRLVRGLIHVAAFLIFLWLIAGMSGSFERNGDYLISVDQKVVALDEQVRRFYEEDRLANVPEVLAASHGLAEHPGLMRDSPGLAWRYGMYVAGSIGESSEKTHRKLQEKMLSPYLVRRVESVLTTALLNKDRQRTYDTLRVYLMLFDAERFDAADVRNWVHDDWSHHAGADAFGGRIAVVEQFDMLLNGQHPFVSPFAKDEGLIRQARTLLDGNTSIERLYERAKASVVSDSPPDFTLLRAVGPQAGTLFARASGEPLERGVPGIFTYVGYHEVFSPRLNAFVQKALQLDQWVMGRSEGALTQAHNLTRLSETETEIRRLYLQEYAKHWNAFLLDVRIVTGDNLAFDQEVLRQFAAPDSPLARLGRACVHETTLSRTTVTNSTSLADRALTALGATDKGAQIGQAALRASARQEREWLDAHFSALREIVTGSAESQTSDTLPSARSQLDVIASLANAYYTSLVIADNALKARTMPPPSEAAHQLKLEAEKLPPPFRAVLTTLARQGERNVSHAIGEILHAQMEATVGESCRLAIDGKYPFSPKALQEVNADDFVRIFAAGGVLNGFFDKILAPYVDTTVSPWRYKLTTDDAHPIAGPALEPFQRARQIKDVFFRDASGKELFWTLNLKVTEVDPEIVELRVDFDGQTQRYVHGPITPLHVVWPGPRGGVSAEITANPRVRPDTSTFSATGPWALLRILSKGKLANSSSANHFIADYDFDGRKARLDVDTGSQPNPWTTDLLTGFYCPSRSDSSVL